MNPVDAAIEHIKFCRSQGMSPLMVLESIGVRDPKCPTWGQVLDVLMVWIAMFQAEERA